MKKFSLTKKATLPRSVHFREIEENTKLRQKSDMEDSAEEKLLDIIYKPHKQTKQFCPKLESQPVGKDDDDDNKGDDDYLELVSILHHYISL